MPSSSSSLTSSGHSTASCRGAPPCRPRPQCQLLWPRTARPNRPTSVTRPRILRRMPLETGRRDVSRASRPRHDTGRAHAGELRLGAVAHVERQAAAAELGELCAVLGARHHGLAARACFPTLTSYALPPARHAELAPSCIFNFFQEYIFIYHILGTRIN